MTPATAVLSLTAPLVPRSETVFRSFTSFALSRYVHLNPVRVQKLGLGKPERARHRVGLSPAPSLEIVRERMRVLREFKWSSYGAYAGLAATPKWLETNTILRMGGGRAAERRKNYRRYVEGAVREALASTPWEDLEEQAVLGSQDFVGQLRKHVRGDTKEQRGVARLLHPRPALEEVVRRVEEMRGEKWEEFRDRHGNDGRDLVLYLGRKHCGLTLGELAEAVGLRHYAAVGHGGETLWQAARAAWAATRRMRPRGEKLYVEM